MPNELLARAVPAIAGALAADAVQKSRLRMNERDDLQRVARDTLKELAAGQPGPVQVQTGRPLDYPQHWPRLGRVDIALSAPHWTVFLELKCGSKKDALGPCAWDVLKCALALRQGTASHAYLLAATTSALWKVPLRGAEFFMAKCEWTAGKLRADYEDCWRQWERERKGYAPLRVPVHCATEFVAAEPFQIGAVEWEVRLARVWADDGDWHDWQRFGAI